MKNKNLTFILSSSKNNFLEKKVTHTSKEREDNSLYFFVFIRFMFFFSPQEITAKFINTYTKEKL